MVLPIHHNHAIIRETNSNMTRSICHYLSIEEEYVALLYPVINKININIYYSIVVDTGMKTNEEENPFLDTSGPHYHSCDQDLAVKHSGTNQLILSHSR